MVNSSIILASRSENRRQLLASLGVTFSVMPSGVDEDAILADDPETRAKLIALAKARDVAQKHTGFIIAADSFSMYNGKEYQKPISQDDAHRMLRELSGQQGRVVSGVCIIDTHEGHMANEANVIHLQCKALTEHDITQYVASRPVTEWAAAYNPLDDMSVAIFNPIEPYPYRLEYYGLGIETLVRELERARIPYDVTAALPKSSKTILKGGILSEQG